MKEKSSITYKELYEQPQCFKGIIDTLGEIYSVLDGVFSKENNIQEVIFTGCGTSLYIGQSAAHAFYSLTGIPTRAVPCSELYFYPDTYFKSERNFLVVPITRKSYTSEVRMAIDRARTYSNVRSLAITCDPDSRLYNDYMILSPDSKEDSIIMTKSFTGMVLMSMVMAYYVAGKKEKIDALKDYQKQAEELLHAMDQLSKKIVYENPSLNLYVVLGQGVYYGIANECMNKMKEMGIVNSEGNYSLEYRHGPMSLADENTLIINLVSDASSEFEAKLLTELKSYGAVTLAIGEGVNTLMPDADYKMELNYGYSDMQYAPLIGFIGQFIGYYIAQKKDIDADSPRNLSQAIVIK